MKRIKPCLSKLLYFSPQNFLFLISLLFIIICSNNLAAQDLWSDPATWGGAKPIAGEQVVIPDDAHIILDENTPALSVLTINGTLEFARQNLNLTADCIVVNGTLEIGTEAQPFEQKAILTLTDDPVEDGLCTGNRGIMVHGTLELHGATPAVLWTKINAHAPQGSTALTLMETVDWQVDDQIIVAPTDYYEAGNGISITQRLNLTAINGEQVNVDAGLNAFRWGLLQYPTANGMSLSDENVVEPPVTDTDTESTPLVLDERAEVGNLTRNIVIQASDDVLWNEDGFGVHVMVMPSGVAHVDGVEFRRAGQLGNLGRYPFHWHMLSYAGTETLGDATGQYIRNSSINQSRNRGIVIHGTNGVLVENNVLYDIRGHGIFTEDAVERRNTITGNLVLHVRNPDLPANEVLKQHEFGNRGSSGFWISNPDNIVTNNTAADCRTNGFWLPFPANPWGLSAGVLHSDGEILNPSRLLFGVFDNNTTHSNGLEGIMLDNVEIDEAGNTYPYQYFSTTDGRDIFYNSGTLRRFTLSRYTTWKNGSNGIWDRSTWVDNIEMVSADNCGRFFAGAGADGMIERGLVVGTSLNFMMNGTGRPDNIHAGNLETPAAFATYHSAFDIRNNIVVNFPMVANTRSGVFATDDYYIRPVEKGQVRNINNLLIDSHPGVKLETPYDYFVFAGAMWDPHNNWGGSSVDDYLVYDMPFFTYGQTPQIVQEGAADGGVLVQGPFYGFSEFVLNEANLRWADYMEIQVTRLDENFNTVGDWQVAESDEAWSLGHMRHFAAHPSSYYQLEFPGIEVVSDLGLTISNMLTTEDEQVVAVEYDGSFEIEQLYISSVYNYMGENHANWPTSYEYKHIYQAVESRAAVIQSAGETYWHDVENNLVWTKIVGGIDQQWNDEDFLPTDDERQYRQFYLRIFGDPRPLAVDGLDFSAKIHEDNNIALTWTVDDNQAHDFYTLERSKNGQDWEHFSKIRATSARHYQTFDKAAFEPITYYRLKISAWDGTIDDSDIIWVEMNKEQQVAGEFYPNPSITGQVNLDYFSQQETPIHIQVFNSKGQLVTRERRMVDVGNHVLNFDLANLGGGLYFIKIENNRRSVFRKLLIK